MNGITMETHLRAAMEEVMESMFYLALDGEVEVPAALGAEWMTRQLSFVGAQSGSFGIGTSQETAQMMASNFLGQDADELNEAQVTDVLGEVANMVCGSVLGRTTSKETFDLTHPCDGNGWPDGASMPGMICHGFSFEGNTLGVWLQIR